MREKIAISFLAFGDEHINEFNYISKKLLNFGDIFVCTNDKNRIDNNVNIIENTESFNYNLKRKSIEFSLKNHEIVLIMDTDYYLTNNDLNFSIIDNLDDGMYVIWINESVKFLSETISIKNSTNEYIKKLNDLNNTKKDLYFIDECLFLLKISETEKKINFIKNWDDIFLKTEDIQPDNGNKGAMEGLIIYLSCLMSGIDIFESKKFPSLQILLNNFYHYSKECSKENIYKSFDSKII